MSGALPPTMDDTAIWETWLSPYRMPVVSVADEAGTLAALADRAMDTRECAAAIGADARALSVHLGALAALGYIEKRGDKWRATALSRSWLHPEAEGYYGHFFASFREANPLHAELMATLMTGERPDPAHSRSSAKEWERGDMSDEAAQGIARFMHAHSVSPALSAARHPLFGQFRHLMDVGGGSGVFSVAIARAHPGLRCTVMDLPAMARAAQSYIAQAGLADRVDTAGVNMFAQDWPIGPDAHFFSNVFHDWSEETNLLLTRKSFAALPSGGRIVLHEMLIDDDGCGPWIPAAFSLLMLLGTQGRQYSFTELRTILEAAGFTDVQSVRSGANHYSLVTAVKP
ncbi:MAG: ubiquinone/menaquinone biosynthesis protein [Sphingomonadales bacterium]|nr:ubiquinone/menaquinone biosynthesis protein [Sphingomonadales bacterium]MBD3774675.1 ubiquinone/menaquinone biosynthesis protein [Paracoccaceae bacterium]